jgi:receptor protein-tyrosine kinase
VDGVNGQRPLPGAIPRVSGVPLGCGIPRRFKDDAHLVLLRRTASPVAERYRRLRLRLEQDCADAPGPPQMIVVTSAIPGEGKTTTATNLALAFAEDQERRTLLIDADLRRPTASRFITPEPKFGLSEVLSGEATLDHALIELTDSKLWVLPSGAPRETPLELQQGDFLGSLMVELRRLFDRIVIDAPPTVPFTDAALLAAHADAALLVVRAGTTTKPLIRRARESLAGTNLLGVVLNEVEFTVVDRYYYRYDDYQPGRYAPARKHERPT